MCQIVTIPIMESEACSDSPDSQIITKMIKSGHIRLTSGQTSELLIRILLTEKYLEISGGVLADSFLIR